MGSAASQDEAPPAGPGDGGGGAPPSADAIYSMRHAAGEGAGDLANPTGSDPLLYVKRMDGVTHTIEHINWHATVIWLKRKIFEQSGIPIEAQRLIFAGRQQEDDRLLQWIGGQTGSTLHLIVRDGYEVPGWNHKVAKRNMGGGDEGDADGDDKGGKGPSGSTDGGGSKGGGGDEGDGDGPEEEVAA